MELDNELSAYEMTPLILDSLYCCTYLQWKQDVFIFGGCIQPLLAYSTALHIIKIETEQ